MSDNQDNKIVELAHKLGHAETLTERLNKISIHLEELEEVVYNVCNHINPVLFDIYLAKQHNRKK